MNNGKILVWDWPVRLGHWLMVAGFTLAWLSSESESWRLVHVLAGGTVMAVALFRLPWGLLGSRYARFSDFVHGPAQVRSYLASLLETRPQHHLGHNPAGGWAIVLLLALGLACGSSGWAIYNDIGGHWLEELHEGLAVAMLCVVAIHLAGVLSATLLHRENLVRAMLTGYKTGPAAAAITSARPLAGILLLAWVALAAWWLAS